MVSTNSAANVTTILPNTGQGLKAQQPLTFKKEPKRYKYKYLNIGLYDDSLIAMLLQKSVLKEMFGSTTKICLTARPQAVRLWLLTCSIDILIMDVVQRSVEHPLDFIKSVYLEYVEKHQTHKGFAKIIFNSSAPQWVVSEAIEKHYKFLNNVDWCFIQKPGKRADVFTCILNLLGNPEGFFEGNQQLRLIRNLASVIGRVEGMQPSTLDGLHMAFRNVFFAT